MGHGSGRENHNCKRYISPVFTAALLTIAKTWKQPLALFFYCFFFPIGLQGSNVIVNILSRKAKRHGPFCSIYQHACFKKEEMIFANILLEILCIRIPHTLSLFLPKHFREEISLPEKKIIRGHHGSNSQLIMVKFIQRALLSDTKNKNIKGPLELLKDSPTEES